MKAAKLSKKVSWVVLIVYTILFALLNVVVFTVFKPWKYLDVKQEKLIFWFAYAFLAVAYVFQLISVFTGRFEDGMEAAFFGFPLVVVAGFYFVITLILSVVFMIIATLGNGIKSPAPLTVLIVLQVILFGLYLIAFLISLMHKDVVMEIDKTIKKNVLTIRMLATDVETLAESVDDDKEVKAKLARLAKDIRYSDPMTNEFVADLDLQIKDSIAELEVLVADHDYPAVESKVRQTQLLVSKRNKRLKDSK